MEDLKESIPVEFYNLEKAKVGNFPRVENVGDLIKQLERLPNELPISGWPELYTHEVVVYNVGDDNPHVIIEEVDR